jgi:Hint domain
LPPACPASPPADQTVCSNSLVSCWYSDGANCQCSSCAGGSEYPVCQTINPPEWFCAAPGAGCPKTLPNAGTPCSVPGTDCSPNCSLEVTCKDGVWQWLASECPICAAPDTPIATPSGERPIADLRVGDLVYSVDHDAVVAVPLLQVGHTRVHAHHVMRVVLDDGRVLEVSPGHPTADGRTFGELRAGSLLDSQHRVVSAELVPYRYAATYDILPASSTGAYFAAGALIGSTLRGASHEIADGSASSSNECSLPAAQ